MLPEKELIKTEFTIRDLYLTNDVLITKKSLTRWIALALGLISPNETRTTLIDLLDVLFDFHIKKEPITVKNIMNYFKENGINADEKSIYYHLSRLKKMGLLTNKKGRYSFGEGKLSFLIKKSLQKKFDTAFENIEKALNEREKI